MKQITFLVALLCLSFCACAQNDKPAQQPQFPSLTVQQFVDNIMYDSVMVVDVRTQKEYAMGHIDGAVNVVWGQTFDAEVQKANLPKEKVLAVYCRSGKRSKMAASRLVALGYRVIDLNEGILGWQKAGRPIVTD